MQWTSLTRQPTIGLSEPKYDLHMTECLIIGGGIIGMLTARELLAKGMSVTLIDRGTPGRESSWAGGGIISPLYPWRYDDAVTRLAAWSQQHYSQLCTDLYRESGIDPEYEPSGLLILEPEDTDQALAWTRRFAQTASLRNRSDLGLIEPSLRTEAETAIWMKKVAQVRNPRLVKSARRALEGRIKILDSTQAHELKVKHGRLQGVYTTKGLIRTDKAIVCAGAWTGTLLHQQAPSIRPILGQMILFNTTPGSLTRIVLHRQRYVIPRRDGRILVGSTLEDRGFEKTTTLEARNSLRQFALSHFPLLADADIELQWAGLRPSSPGGIPYICPVPDTAGLFINAGHFRNGVVLAPASARLMSDLVTGSPPIADPAPYTLDAERAQPAPQPSDPLRHRLT